MLLRAQIFDYLMQSSSAFAIFFVFCFKNAKKVIVLISTILCKS